MFIRQLSDLTSETLFQHSIKDFQVFNHLNQQKAANGVPKQPPPPNPATPASCLSEMQSGIYQAGAKGPNCNPT
jgi:hypothetical protein